MDLKEWFRRALASTEQLDYAGALDWFGLRLMPPVNGQPARSWKLEILPDATPGQKVHLNEWLGLGAR